MKTDARPGIDESGMGAGSALNRDIDFGGFFLCPNPFPQSASRPAQRTGRWSLPPSLERPSAREIQCRSLAFSQGLTAGAAIAVAVLAPLAAKNGWILSAGALAVSALAIAVSNKFPKIRWERDPIVCHPESSRTLELPSASKLGSANAASFSSSLSVSERALAKAEFEDFPIRIASNSCSPFQLGGSENLRVGISS